MPLSLLFASCLLIAALAFLMGRGKAFKSAGGDIRKLHSLPGYYGWNSALMVLLPSMAALVIWLAVQPLVINSSVSQMISTQSVEASSLDLIMSDVRRVAEGLNKAVEAGAMTEAEVSGATAESMNVRERLGAVGVALGSDVSNETLQAAQSYRDLSATSGLLRTIAVLALALGGLVFGVVRTNKDFRARNTVERVILGLLIAAASIAILTTVGIVFSLIFNTVEFFKLYPAADFFFGLTWSPSFGGGSDLGILPLIWATLYISLIALAVSVPVGLFAAIYLSEYAAPLVRSVAKPLLEVLAGIPTIVYGLFALLTVGPLLVDIFGSNGVLHLGWMQGGTAVMTAGLVMGIMLIPFVSSLSDDIINAVPQAMRDGSLGLGATHSETVKQVILPAALPGIVGAILLAASRAIGETMIVVLGAGAAARLSMNPFDAMTTVTAKIVSQLTGDADFASPEALVAFALGMTLFVMTLGLNVIALYIVRKYREQYE
ncbi:phosphate ABC transporter permease subunit PstC [Roseibium suaedae]|uniref:Phosphate transport system permease protein n=1 Tax=Roseibium suaedae TaxID=735517 RepID=A0A1M7BBL1_9HYPH|nr:phosphate ABC transporter permease subunit PstC [Roseibium suaedae]SHL52019.1 phosphate ABC transporter membrane protein 1, PhoT family [Roseibium suaedae]